MSNINYSMHVDKLIALLQLSSKHFKYQLLHPLVENILGISGYISGKFEKERQNFFTENLNCENFSVLDIGANTGYFSYCALEHGAAKVSCFEGNLAHAEFINQTAVLLKLEKKLFVDASYYNFFDKYNKNYDLIYCLNVLHHLGDDFADKNISIEVAKSQVLLALNNLAASTKYLWFQLGFNWKGNKNFPLFANGSKTDIIDFISNGTVGFWDIEAIGVFDPVSNRYEYINKINAARFDNLGEFLNRPIFKLKSKINSF